MCKEDNVQVLLDSTLYIFNSRAAEIKWISRFCEQKFGGSNNCDFKLVGDILRVVGVLYQNCLVMAVHLRTTCDRGSGAVGCGWGS